MENATEQSELSAKQVKAIPRILAERTYEQGCKAAGISRATFYGWLREAPFRAEFDRQRSRLADAAFLMIVQNVEKAVFTLVGLLDADDERVQRLSANDVIRHFLKHREIKELEDRLAALEERLEAR